MSPENHITEATAAIGRLPGSLLVASSEKAHCVVSWVQQAGFTPLCVTLALGKGRHILNNVLKGYDFALSILPEDGGKLAKPFFSGDEAAMQSAIQFIDGVPVVSGSLGFLKVRYQRHMSSGDHEIILAEVSDGRLFLPDVKPFVHLRKDGSKY